MRTDSPITVLAAGLAEQGHDEDPGDPVMKIVPTDATVAVTNAIAARIARGDSPAAATWAEANLRAVFLADSVVGGRTPSAYQVAAYQAASELRDAEFEAESAVVP